MPGDATFHHRTAHQRVPGVTQLVEVLTDPGSILREGVQGIASFSIA
jgi:hypothetical protein